MSRPHVDRARKICLQAELLPVRKSASMEVVTARTWPVLRAPEADAGFGEFAFGMRERGDMAGLVITGGRVVDPASGMDAVGDVAVLDGRIAAVGTGLGGAERSIDATGLVVAPGFIDLHAHGQSIPAYRVA